MTKTPRPIEMSRSDIKDKVNALNEQIFQASASLRDSLIHKKYGISKEELEITFADVCSIVSEPLARVLVRKGQKPGPVVNPLLVEIVLGMYFVHFCSSRIGSRSAGIQETSDFLEEPILSQEIRWTHAFMLGVGKIFKVAKWGIRPRIRRRVDDFIAFKQKLPGIFQAVKDLGLALEENVTPSSDLEIDIILPAVPFDHRCMQDVYGETPPQGYSEESAEVVAGTTGIGLKQIVQMLSGDAISRSVLAPDVVLVSTLQQEGLLPPPPPPTRLNKKRSEDEGEQGHGISSPSKAPLDSRHDHLDAENSPPTVTNDEALLAARAIMDGTGATLVMVVIDKMLALRKEIAQVSNFLAENIRHTSYELFQVELDCCYQDSEKTIGERLSKFLRDHSETEELSLSLIKITTQIFITSFCASEWDRNMDTPLHIVDRNDITKNHKERKAEFLRKLINVFKTAAWMIPGSAIRTAFEDSLDLFFKSMEEIETALKKVPEFTTVSLSFVSPGEALADFKTYAEDATENGNQMSKTSHNVVLGTAALGVRCLFQDRVKGVVEEKPRTLLTARVILESNLQYIFAFQKERKPTTQICFNFQGVKFSARSTWL